MSNYPERFKFGDRVRIIGHEGWPDGATGTIAEFPAVVIDACSQPPGSPVDFDAAGIVRRIKTSDRAKSSQWVEFDTPTDDGSGDGPYRQAEILIDYLRLL
jgi:hypothetical protein